MDNKKKINKNTNAKLRTSYTYYFNDGTKSDLSVRVLVKEHVKQLPLDLTTEEIRAERRRIIRAWHEVILGDREQEANDRSQKRLHSIHIPDPERKRRVTNPEKLYLEFERYEPLREAIAKLTPIQQDIIKCVYWYGYSLGEFAREKNRHKSTVHENLHLALSRLRNALDGLDEEE